MYHYPKLILSISQQSQSYVDAGMEIKSKEEVALRVRLKEALLICDYALILQGLPVFNDKQKYWGNMPSIASGIGRFNDIFIRQNLYYYDGEA